ncbi:MAG TPA: dTMP kinase [Thermodesulfobacteriota bacterium]|nr:dTMP kinase [Thermodesulfobacteriota bacterium]
MIGIVFITFEGVEGSGKTTQAGLLKDFLLQKGYKVTLTREPGWGAVGRLIRRMLLEEKELDLDPLAELCLFCADRVQHVRDLIKPKLKKGEIVICDRYADSTVVYQGYGRRLDLDLVRKLAKASTLNLQPRLTFLFNLPVKLGLSRLEKRAGKTKMDEESLEFHERIRQGYIFIAQKEPERIRIINAARDIGEVQEEIRRIVLEYLPKPDSRLGSKEDRDN